jgi:hypothetical protein
MKPKPLSELTTEELIKTEKGMKIAVIVLSAGVVLMVFSGGYLFAKKGFSTSTLLPIIFLPLWMINYRNWKKIKEELQKRS